jgi:hypothetical protein
MATIKFKRGSGVPSSDPSNPVQDVPLAAGEPAMDTATGRVYIAKTGDGSSGDIVEVGSTALDSNISNNLVVGNDATISGDVLVSGTTTLGNVSTVDLTVSDDLTVTDDATIGDNLTVGGNIIATGDVGGDNLNINNWNLAYNYRPTDLDFDDTTGVLTLTKGVGTETTDLDGRYFNGQIYEGTFTPVVKDNTGNTASIDATSFGRYRKITTPFSDFIYVSIQVGNINKSNMVGTDALRIELPSYLPYTDNVSISGLVSNAYRNVVKPNNNDNIVGALDNISASSQTVFRLQFRGGSTSPRDIEFDDLDGNLGTFVIVGWFF